MFKRYFILCIVFIYSISIFSQRAKTTLRLSRPEKLWVLSHPFIATKTRRITQNVILVVNEIKKDTVLDGDESGGQVDAFRHIYWMTLLAQKIKPKKALKLGIAHEKGNKIMFEKMKMEEGSLPDSISCVMDIENDKIGVEIGKNNKELKEKELQTLIKNKILKGEAKILLKNKNGDFLDVQDNVIDLNNYKGKWNVPKCLVNSNKTGGKDLRKDSGKNSIADLL